MLAIMLFLGVIMMQPEAKAKPQQLKLPDTIDMEEFSQLADLSYYELRARLDLRSDSCIYFTDAEGTIIPISSSTRTVYFMGAPHITVNVTAPAYEPGNCVYTCNGTLLNKNPKCPGAT